MPGANDPQDQDDLDPAMAEQVARFMDGYFDERDRRAKRNTEPKNWAEALDRISDAVADKLEARANNRQSDEPPSSGSSGNGAGGGFLDWFLTPKGKRS